LEREEPNKKKSLPMYFSHFIWAGHLGRGSKKKHGIARRAIRVKENLGYTNRGAT